MCYILKKNIIYLMSLWILCFIFLFFFLYVFYFHFFIFSIPLHFPPPILGMSLNCIK